MARNAIPQKEAHGGMAKIATWLIGIGCMVGLFGLTMIPAALKPDNNDKSILSLCVLTISFAMMLTAGGLYLKARSHTGVSDSESAAKRRGKSNCDSCGKLEPVILCRVHQLHLCSDCLATHYDFRSCAYVPSTRRGATRPSTLAQASGI